MLNDIIGDQRVASAGAAGCADSRGGGVASALSAQGLPPPKRVQLAYITDGRLFGPTLVSMMSALDGTQEPVTVHFFGHRLSEVEIGQIRSAARLWPESDICYRVVTEDMVSGGQTDGYRSHAQMAILHLPRMLSGRVLYMDGDTIVNGDVASLFDLDLNGRNVGAVRDYQTLWTIMNMLPEDWHDGLVNEERRLHPHGRGQMFNSGVLVLDVDSMNAVPGLIDGIMDHMDLRCDQQSLNYHLKGRVQWMDPAWNAMPGVFHLYPKIHQSLTNGEIGSGSFLAPMITHFSGIAKPWHDFSTEDLFTDIHLAREKLHRDLNLADPYTPQSLFTQITSPECLIEYAHAVESYRKSAARLMSMF